MKVGAERKKLMILGGLVALAATVFYFNSGGDGPPKEQERRASSVPSVTSPRTATPSAGPAPPVISQAPRQARGSRGSQEFRPSLKPKRPEDRVDPMKVDPTLRLELLAKVQAINAESGQRSLFDFSAAPPPKTPDVKVVPKSLKPDPVAAAAANPGAPPVPLKPQAPPIPLKFYGFITPPTKAGLKRAFFTEGEEIFVASEGDIIKKRYKVVRIGVNSVVLEDVQFQHQQTLPLEEEKPV
jgi:hypothetical protein